MVADSWSTSTRWLLHEVKLPLGACLAQPLLKVVSINIAARPRATTKIKNSWVVQHGQIMLKIGWSTLIMIMWYDDWSWPNIDWWWLNGKCTINGVVMVDHDEIMLQIPNHRGTLCLFYFVCSRKHSPYTIMDHATGPTKNSRFTDGNSWSPSIPDWSWLPVVTAGCNVPTAAGSQISVVPWSQTKGVPASLQIGSTSDYRTPCSLQDLSAASETQGWRGHYPGQHSHQEQPNLSSVSLKSW